MFKCEFEMHSLFNQSSNINNRQHVVSAISLAVLLLSISTFPQTAIQKYSQVKIAFENIGQIKHLADDGLIFDHVHHEAAAGNTFFLNTIINNRELEILQRNGLSYRVLIDDMAAHYKSRRQLSQHEKRQIKAASGLQGFGFGSMGGFYTFAEAVAELDSMRNLYPHLITEKQSIGSGHNGNKIWLVKISDNPDLFEEDEPEILYTALHHAREPHSLMTLMFFMYYLLENYGSDPEATFLVDNRQLYFVPVVNPDGYLYNEAIAPDGGGMWRKNRREVRPDTFGVDLNRNYGFQWGFDNSGSSAKMTDETYRGPQAFSEPETEALRELCISHNFKIALNYHTFGNVLIYPWGYLPAFLTPDSLLFLELGAKMTGSNDYAFGTVDQTLGKVTNGDAGDWMYGDNTEKNRIISFTPEIGGSDDGFWPEQNRIFFLAEQNLAQNLTAARAAGGLAAYIDNTIADTGNRNGFIDPGETAKMVLPVKNIGLGPLRDINLKLKSLDPLVSIIKGNSDSLLDISSRSTAVSDTFSFLVDVKAPAGLQPQLELEIDYGGFIEKFTIGDLLIGTPDIPFADDAEYGPEDWQTNGSWTTTTQYSHSPDSAFTDSPFGYYLPNTNNSFILKKRLNLLGASAAFLEFYTRWDIEKNYDAGMVEVSIDSINWIALNGIYTTSGSGLGEQKPAGTPLYDGSQVNWVKEVIDLSPVLGASQVYLRFRLRSNSHLERDGWYIDDIVIKIFKDVVVGIDSEQTHPEKPLLAPNYPNPFNPTTNIGYRISDGSTSLTTGFGFVELKIFDITGKEVKTLVAENKTAGFYTVSWDGTDRHGNIVASGIYFYVLKTGDTRLVRKMLLAK